MHSEYEDILAVGAAAGITPKWWDENGVPRFYAHHPNLCPDIYADEVVLLKISCQSCGNEIPVQLSWSSGDKLNAMIMEEWRAQRSREKPRKAAGFDRTLVDSVKDGSIHYGDPPYHLDERGEFCHAGGTMNCYDLAVLEFWRRDRDGDYSWARVPELEVELPDAKDPDR